MRPTFIRNLTANALQLILNQGFGLLAFYILAIALPKEEFGRLNWILAVLLTTFGVLGLGIDQLVVRKIAAGEDASQIFSLFVFHTIITGLGFYSILALSYFFLPGKSGSEAVLILGLGKLFFYSSSPFKQLAAGMERFGDLMYMSVVSAVVKGIAMLLLLAMGMITLQMAVLVYLLADIAEFAVSAFIAKTRLNAKTNLKNIRQHYVFLLRQAWPQAGSVIFSTLLTRVDWILVGLMLSTTRLAEYSFAYRLFEMALLPLMIIGPVLLPWFSRQYSQGADVAGRRSVFFLHTEVILATISALLFAVLWTPIMEPLTNGHYGKLNQPVIFILAAAIPFLYVNNFLWTIIFSQKQLKTIFRIIMITVCINLLADVLLIPYFKNAGAALGFLFATLVQCALFLYYNPAVTKKSLAFILSVPAAAAIVVFISVSFQFNLWMLPAIALTGFISVLYLFGFMRKRQLRFLNHMIRQ